MQKGVRYNEGHALYLSVVARKEGTKRGALSKKTTENGRWADKFFALYQNVLFYFENDQSTRPSGIYLLEGCTCERAPAPKVSALSKEPMEKQQVSPVLVVVVVVVVLKFSHGSLRNRHIYPKFYQTLIIMIFTPNVSQDKCSFRITEYNVTLNLYTKQLCASY